MVANDGPSFSLTGLTASLEVVDSGGASIFADSRDLAPLPPGGRSLQSFAFAAAPNPPGDHQAELTIVAAEGSSEAVCSASFTVDDSAATGEGLTGTLTVAPALVNAGDPTDVTYSVENGGNADLVDVALRIVFLDPETGGVVGELSDSVSLLAVGESFTATQVFSSVGLETNKSYLVVLLAQPAGVESEHTLDDASLTVVNAPPDCSTAVADPDDLWPPNHRLIAIDINGVTDPDGDPVTLTVDGIFQDEHTDDFGSGDTCPDATGVGGPTASVRAERSGRQDGRIYHPFFTTDDGRGGTCEGEVTVCVPHDRGDPVCGDQGALFDSTSCP